MSKLKKKIIDIIIVTHQSSKCLDDLFFSFKNFNFDLINLIFVDNASSKDELLIYDELMIKHLKNLTITKILLKENKGYSYGVNCGLNKSVSNYILLINPDIILNLNWCTQIQKLLPDNKFDIISTKSKDQFNNIDNNIHRFPGLIHNILGDFRCGENHLNKKSAFIDFSCILIKSDIFSNFGKLTNFFLYGEDVEYWLRLSRVKLNIFYDNSCFYTHKRSTSSSYVNTNRRDFFKHERIIYSDMYNYMINNKVHNRIAYCITMMIGILVRLILSKDNIQIIRFKFFKKNLFDFIKGSLFIDRFHVT